MNELTKRLQYHVSGAIERGEAEPVTEVISDYERRIRALESEGLTRSDAQAVVDAQILNNQ